MPNENFIAAIISPDRRVHDDVSSSLNGNSDIGTVWTMAEYPDPAALATIRGESAGCIVFLDFTDPLRAKAVAAELDRSCPRAGTIALCSIRQPQDLVQLMQLGIREILDLPVESSEVMRAVARVGRKLRTPSAVEEGGRIYAFSPAKPGSGATTLAVHSAAAAARLGNDRTLLLDFDFRLGMTSFLLKLNGTNSVLDAIASRDRLGPEVWDCMASQRGKLDILGSAPAVFGHTDPESGAVELLDLARQAYPTICVDLPGEMRAYEIETMHRARECFLVTTPDIGSLHMAKRKAEMMLSLGIHSKVSVILNRVESRNISVKDIEAILQLPVRFSIPSAEKLISEATQAGKALEGRSPLVAQIESIARRMSPGVASGTGATGRKFVEMFSVSPARDRSRWGW